MKKVKFWRVVEALRSKVLRVAVLTVRALAVKLPILPTFE